MSFLRRNGSNSRRTTFSYELIEVTSVINNRAIIVGERLQIFMVPFVGGLGVFAACAAYVGLGNLITKRVCGVSDTRVLT